MKAMRTVAASVFLVLTFEAQGPAQKPELVVQTGHSKSVTSVAFSPDSKLLASGSGDGTIKIWNVATGDQLRTLAEHTQNITSVAFNFDGSILASGSFDYTARLWDVKTGRAIHTLTGHSLAVEAVALSHDGKTLATGSLDRTIKLWDVATGKELGTLAGHAGNVSAVAFGPDGKTLVSGSWDHSIRLWDVATGKTMRTFEGHPVAIMSVAFSSDGSLIASGGGLGIIKLWDANSGRELHNLAADAEWVSSVAFSPDHKMLASGSNNLEGHTIKIWNVKTGTEIPLPISHSAPIYSLAISPDNRTLALGDQENTIDLVDIVGGVELRTLKGHAHALYSVALSPNGKILAHGGRGQGIKLWDLVSQSDLRNLVGHTSDITSVAFAPQGEILASGSIDTTVKLWSVATGRELRTLKTGAARVDCVAFSPDGRLLASGGSDNTIKLWDVATGQLLRTLRGHADFVHSIAFAHDGDILASASGDTTVKLWNVATGQEIRTLKGHSNWVESLAFSPDASRLATASVDKTIKLWNVATGSEIHTLTGHRDVVETVAFSPDGKTLVSGSWDRTIKLWDVESGRERQTLSGHSDAVVSISFYCHGSILASGSLDAQTKLWDMRSGKNLASLIALNEKDWAVVTPDGLFDGSPAAWNLMIWRFAGSTSDFVPVEVFFNEFYYPGLLADILSGKHLAAPQDISQKDRRQPQLRLSLADGQSSATRFTARQAALKVEVAQAPAGAQDVRLFRNGSLVKLWDGEARPGKDLSVEIPIVAGENRLTAYAFNRANVKSSDAQLTVIGDKSLERKGTAYILVVGINEYSNPQFDLRYARADAEAFGKELREHQDQLKQFARIEVVPLPDREATKGNILLALRRLAGTATGDLPQGAPAALKNIEKAQPEDEVVVYFAGHGTAGPSLPEASQPTGQRRFYLLPYDLGYTGPRPQIWDNSFVLKIAPYCISDIELERAFEKVDAGRILLAIDACQSGQALESDEKRRGPMNSKGLAQLAYEKGMYILAAAQSYQAAKEASRLGHGYLTYALVEEGLKTRSADADGNGLVLLREWLDFAIERVPKMQEEKMNQARDKGQYPAFASCQEDIPDPEQSSVQRPRVFYRRELEAQPLIVARPEITEPKR